MGDSTLAKGDKQQHTPTQAETKGQTGVMWTDGWKGGVEGGGVDRGGVDRGGVDGCGVDRGGVDRHGVDSCGVDTGGVTGVE